MFGVAVDEKSKEAMRLWTLALPTVSAFVTSLVRDFADRDDILQETAVAVIESYERYDPSLSFVAWAIGIAKNQAKSHDRRKNRTRLTFDSESLEAIALAFESEGSADRRLDHLGECFEALDERSRELCRWRYDSDLKPMAISELIGVTPNVVAKALQRIRDRLRACMKSKAFAEGG